MRIIPLIDPSQTPLANKVLLVQRVDQKIRSEFPLVKQVHITCIDRRKEIRVLNTHGVDVRQTLFSMVLRISVIVEDNGILQTGHEVIGAQRGWEIVDNDEVLVTARRAATRALAKLKAPKAKAGEMPVILSASAGGTFIHEALGHSLEADHIQEGSSPTYHNAIGRKIASDKITVIDDPTLPFQRGSYFFDDEGACAAPTVLVRQGQLTDYLYDQTTAMRQGRESNGHGRRESYRFPAVPRMSNIYIAPGPDDPAQMVKDLKHGLFVTRMGGGQVNTATGEFVFEVDEGYWVEEGQIRHLVRDANLLGIGPDALRSIDRVGWDIGWGIGTCGKEGQNVPVSDGQPTIRLPKIIVGGQHENL
jgi:TldD protein